MGRTRLSMLPLGHYLRAQGHDVSFFGYSVARRDFVRNAQLLLHHITANQQNAPYGIVAHSLGGVLTRFISAELPPGWTKFIMLGPPNRPVVMAKRLTQNHLYHQLTGSSGQLLGSEEFYERLPIPTVDTLVISGRRGRTDRFSPFGDLANDGIVSVEETRLEGAEQLVVPAIHTWIMNDPVARLVMKEFLSSPPSRRISVSERSG
jgi:hypothetical protein